MKKRYILKENAAISALVAKRQRHSNRYYTIYYQPSETLQIAVSVPKKFGTAVKRNYERRVIKEIVRPYLDKLGNYQLLIVGRDNLKHLTFGEKQTQLTNLLGKLGDKHETQ